MRTRTLSIIATLGLAAGMLGIVASSAGATGGNIRLTHDEGVGYLSAYTMATGIPYTDGILSECSIARGRQNEPAVAADPRDPRVLVGSSNDYCGVFGPPGDPATGNPAGPIWLGYYRSENAGASFQSSLVPGYPGDTSPYAALAQVRTASSGDPVLAWDGHGRLFVGSESSDDRNGTPKSFGDQWVATYENPNGENGATIDDGKRYVHTVTVAKGSAAPNYLGLFNDKTAIEVDRTGGAYDGTVYYAWSRFTGVGISNIYFVRSTDHGATFSKPKLLTPNSGNLQDPQISVTGNGHVYVTYDTGALRNGQQDGIQFVRSINGGATFTKPAKLLNYTAWEAGDLSPSGAFSRDCGDGSGACQSGYTFFRNDSSTRSTADQTDKANEYVYVVFNASKPGSEVDTGSTYGTEGSGIGSQSGAYFVRFDGATGTHTEPMLLDAQAVGQQNYPAIAADGGVLHTMWWDSRNDPCGSFTRPIGNCADRSTVPALDVYASRSTDGGATWLTPTRLTDFTSNGNWEQFSGRTVPFGGDYLWVTSVGGFAYSTWTDWRNTVAGSDPREVPDDGDGADVMQCRAFDPATGTYGPDTCPHAGGLDQDIYGAVSP